MDEALQFHSTRVAAYTEDDVHVVGFGDHDEQPDNYIILARSDEPDSVSGDDMVGISSSRNACEISAAVSAIYLRRQAIEFVIREEKAAQVGAARLGSDFTIDDDAFSELERHLGLIVAGTGIVFAKTAT